MDATAWDQRYAGTELVWSGEPNRTVAAEVTGLPAGRALDLAAGEGRNAVWLAQQGWTVTAVDFSAAGLDKARRLAEQHGVAVETVQADVTTYRPESGHHDLVVVAYLQLPAEVLTPVLAAAAEALAPGGTLLLVGHDRANLTDGVGGPQDPAVLHTVEEVTAALAGLDVVRAERIRRPVQVDGEERSAIDTLVRALRR
ncbi:class I SAM-dependent methyltransferase [Pseudonocardia sp.]|uniref:class I SAM-dependent methyltransferase n=1 Tax=Pseudonocardia sp. TaxID=60912 RepID=UPI002634225D|nr:class I SAM-dependent methyltransferase [Pseudonocardia sp.]